VRTRVATMVCALLAVAAFAAFAEALRRYATGVKGPIDYLQGAWQPPFGATVLTVAAFVLIALMALFVRQLVATHPFSGDPGHSGPRQSGDVAPASALPTLPEAGKHVRHDGGRHPVSVGPDNAGL
jgi:hypothetical protein